MSEPATLRPDLRAISDLVPMRAHVLDVGCSNGELLCWLHAHRQTTGSGIEIDQTGDRSRPRQQIL